MRSMASSTGHMVTGFPDVTFLSILDYNLALKVDELLTETEITFGLVPSPLVGGYGDQGAIDNNITWPP